MNRYLAAHEALWRNSAGEHDAGICDETSDYLRLNRAAYESSSGVSWWRQAVLDQWLLFRLKRQGYRWCSCGGSLTLATGNSCPAAGK